MWNPTKIQTRKKLTHQFSKIETFFCTFYVKLTLTYLFWRMKTTIWFQMDFATFWGILVLLKYAIIAILKNLNKFEDCLGLEHCMSVRQSVCSSSLCSLWHVLLYLGHDTTIFPIGKFTERKTKNAHSATAINFCEIIFFLLFILWCAVYKSGIVFWKQMNNGFLFYRLIL